MKKLVLGSTIVLGLFLASFKSVSAAVRCETQYGGNQICVTTGQLQVNKTVYNPIKKEYVDNVFPPCNESDDKNGCDATYGYRFQTNEAVTFKIVVKNVGDNTLHNVKVTDTLPQYLFLTGETPSEFKYANLNPGESQEMTVRARVVAESQLPTRSCDFNVVDANSDENEHDKDTAKVCVGKGVLGITTLPKAGPEASIIIFGASAAFAFAGIALVKFAKKDSLILD